MFQGQSLLLVQDTSLLAGGFEVERLPVQELSCQVGLGQKVVESYLNWYCLIIDHFGVFLFEVVQNILHVAHLNIVLRLLASVNHDHFAIFSLLVPPSIFFQSLFPLMVTREESCNSCRFVPQFLQFRGRGGVELIFPQFGVPEGVEVQFGDRVFFVPGGPSI